MKEIKRQLVCNQFAMYRIIESLIFTPEKKNCMSTILQKKKNNKATEICGRFDLVY